MAVTFSKATVSAGKVIALYFEPNMTQVGGILGSSECLQSDVLMFLEKGASHSYRALQARGNNPETSS